MVRCRNSLLAFGLLLLVGQSTYANIFLNGEYANDVNAFLADQAHINQIDMESNPFLSHAISSRAAGFQGPQYLPPVEKQQLVCSGQQVCVRKNQCSNGYFTQQNLASSRQDCDYNSEVCCTYRPSPTKPTVQSTPCTGSNYDCVPPNLCSNGQITKTGYVKQQSTDKCYAPEVCCKIPDSTILTEDGYQLRKPEKPFPQPTPQQPRPQPTPQQPRQPTPQQPRQPTPSRPSYPQPTPQQPRQPTPSRPSYPQPTPQQPRQPTPSRPSYPQPTPQQPRQPTPQQPHYPQPTPQQPRQPTPQQPHYPQPTPQQPRQPTPQQPRQPTPSRPSYPQPTPQQPRQPTQPDRGYLPPTTPPRQPGTQPPYQPGTQPPRQPGTQPPRQPGTQPPRQPGTQPPRQPGTQPPRQPGTQPPRQPTNTYIPPKEFGEDILSLPIQPSRKPQPGRPVFDQDLPVQLPTKCAAALNCTRSEYCSATGVISDTPVVLSEDQEIYRVPTTTCYNPEEGFNGVCCRDPNYTDPWPASQLGQYKAELFGDTGAYNPSQNEIVRQQRRANNNPNQQTRVARCASRNFNSVLQGDSPIDAAFGEYPWQAMILLESKKALICGGVIIADNMVATSAHCVQGRKSFDVIIKGGEWKLGSDIEPITYQNSRVKRIELHPNYDSNTLSNDIALLHLDSKLKFDTHIGPLCIDESDPDEYDECFVTGWGKDVLKVHLQDAIMHHSKVSIIDREYCSAGPDQICGQPELNACDLDYGSALACTNGSGNWVMKGIYSSENQCGESLITFAKPDAVWMNRSQKNGRNFGTNFLPTNRF